MAKVRKDTKGRVLHKGESYNKAREEYVYSYTDSFGKRRFLYSRDLGELREKEKKTQKDELDGISIYAIAKADLNFAFDRYIETKSELRSSTKSNYIYSWNCNSSYYYCYFEVHFRKSGKRVNRENSFFC